MINLLRCRCSSIKSVAYGIRGMAEDKKQLVCQPACTPYATDLIDEQRHLSKLIIICRI